MALSERGFDYVPKLPKVLRFTSASDGATECSGLKKFAALEERQYTPNHAKYFDDLRKAHFGWHDV